MVEAARKHNRVVQLGTQSRSLPHVRKAIELIRDGALGDVIETKAWTNQMRANIGHKQPGDPPAELNYDLWVGPAPLLPSASSTWSASTIGSRGLARPPMTRLRSATVSFLAALLVGLLFLFISVSLSCGWSGRPGSPNVHSGE